MKRQTILMAQDEAKRFLKLIPPAMNHYLREDTREWTDYLVTGNKDTAALKRASMDLTRALAEMRKP